MTPSEDRKREQRRPVYDGTSPMVHIVQGMVDLVVLLVMGLIMAFVTALRRALTGEPRSHAPEGHPVPDEDGAYRSDDQSPRGTSGERGTSDESR